MKTSSATKTRLIMNILSLVVLLPGIYFTWELQRYDSERYAGEFLIHCLFVWLFAVLLVGRAWRIRDAKADNKTEGALIKGKDQIANAETK